MKLHMKRLSTPRTWPIKRKGITFITRPNPGPHKFDESISILTVLTEILKIARNRREAEKILQSGQVIVDGTIRKEKKFPVGLMDGISLGSENFRGLLTTKGKLHFKKVSKVDEKPCRIINKTVLKGGKIQLNLFDGTNLIVTDKKYKPGDTVMVSKKEIKKHLKFEKGATVFLTGGNHIGNHGTLEEVTEQQGSLPSKIVVKVGTEKIEGLKKHAFVIEGSILQ